MEGETYFFNFRVFDCDWLAGVMLGSVPVLLDIGFGLAFNVSEVGAGAFLVQMGGDGVDYPVCWVFFLVDIANKHQPFSCPLHFAILKFI